VADTRTDEEIDADLIRSMLGFNLERAVLAKLEFDRRHPNDPKIAEPAHCSECFEGCPKCQKENPCG
jgi:hypothetical protein